MGVYSMSKHAVEAFGDALEAEMAPLADRSRYPEPDDVAEAVLHFFSDAQPKHRYMVVPVQVEAELTIRKAVQELVQLNEKQKFSYDRKALIEMLDAELAKSQGAN